MKKLFISLLMLSLLMSTAAYAAGNPILFKTDSGVKIVAQDAYYHEGGIFHQYQLCFDIVITNSSKDDYNIICDNGYINGWEVGAHGYYKITAGMKRNATLMLFLDDANIHSKDQLSDINELKIKFHAFPDSDYLKIDRSTKKIKTEWVKKKVKTHK